MTRTSRAAERSTAFFRRSQRRRIQAILVEQHYTGVDCSDQQWFDAIVVDQSLPASSRMNREPLAHVAESEHRKPQATRHQAMLAAGSSPRSSRITRWTSSSLASAIIKNL